MLDENREDEVVKKETNKELLGFIGEKRMLLNNILVGLGGLGVTCSP